MKSLQVVTPHMECIFNCPFCIAKGHKHDNVFVNNYLENYELWKNNLIQVIRDNDDLKYVVITGTNEPMQSVECVRNIVDIVKRTNSDIQVEIQTHYYKQHEVYNKIDVVAYSIANVNLLDKIRPMGKKCRYVLILTDSFNNYSLYDIIRLIPNQVSQLTLKCLQDSHGINKEIDDYIAKHRIAKDTLECLKNNYQGKLSIRVDESCMDAEGRYKVFREDGMVYNDWDEEPIKHYSRVRR